MGPWGFPSTPWPPTASRPWRRGRSASPLGKVTSTPGRRTPPPGPWRKGLRPSRARTTPWSCPAARRPPSPPFWPSCARGTRWWRRGGFSARPSGFSARSWASWGCGFGTWTPSPTGCGRPLAPAPGPSSWRPWPTPPFTSRTSRAWPPWPRKRGSPSSWTTPSGRRGRFAGPSGGGRTWWSRASPSGPAATARSWAGLSSPGTRRSGPATPSSWRRTPGARCPGRPWEGGATPSGSVPWAFPSWAWPFPPSTPTSSSRAWRPWP
jgi:hypothetical protein